MKKILLIEDDRGLVDLISPMLKSHEYDVVVAYDGEAGLKKAREEKADLIILDIMLPKLDGFQVCKKIKDDSTSKDIPVLVLTVKAREKDEKTAYAAGADAYIIKPFDSDLLMKKINDLIIKD